MLQQSIALIIILSFIFRLFWQKKKKQIQIAEFVLWLFFWLAGFLAIIFIKQIDKIVFKAGFSGSGIEILFYLAVIILFYLIFKVRLRLEKHQQEITKLTRYLALKEKK